jgi:hypothetical protein
MEQNSTKLEGKIGGSRKRSILRRVVSAGGLLVAFIVALIVTAVVYNNIALWSDATFARRLDSAIKNAEGWVEKHRPEILEEKNVALITMLRECNDIRPNPVLAGIAASFLNTPIKNNTRCWKREVDPNWPITESELDQLISKEYLDNQWTLYAIAPDKTKFDAEKSGLFDRQRWHRRQLTHQLFALTMLRDRYNSTERITKLTENLCERLKADMTYSLPVVDIYIQQPTFVLRAGYPQKVRRRWIERIITEQQSDGGWNDRWFCFTTPRRQLVFDIDETPSDQHATIQAVLALYLVKYRYPEQFGLK